MSLNIYLMTKKYINLVTVNLKHIKLISTLQNSDLSHFCFIAKYALH